MEAKGEGQISKPSFCSPNTTLYRFGFFYRPHHVSLFSHELEGVSFISQ
jgi:hypothetical protein